MSKTSKSTRIIAPIFGKDSDDIVIEIPSPPNTNKGVVINELPPPKSRTKEVADPKKRDHAKDLLFGGPLAKKQRAGREAGVATPTTTMVHQMFTKMDHQNDYEAEVHDWVNVDIDATMDATTKGLLSCS